MPVSGEHARRRGGRGAATAPVGLCLPPGVGGGASPPRATRAAMVSAAGAEQSVAAAPSFPDSPAALGNGERSER